MKVSLSDLEFAMEVISSVEFIEGAAYLRRSDGKVLVHAPELDLEEEFPEGWEDNDDYIPIPDKYDLDLGKRLVFDFIYSQFPEAEEDVSRIFRRKGAFGKFKNYLAHRSKLEQWYEYSNETTLQRLKDWAEVEGFEVID